ncbi:hypothetical protein HWI79_1069 [Cryptosporidium felis]|nr:hypothetical protein HWI79_1069 [Cryptosporidium felis]
METVRIYDDATSYQNTPTRTMYLGGFVPSGEEDNVKQFPCEYELESEINESSRLERDKDFGVTKSDLKTPEKKPFLRKGEGKSLVISNSRKIYCNTSERGNSNRTELADRDSSEPILTTLSEGKFRNKKKPGNITRKVRTGGFDLADSLFLGIEDPEVTNYVTDEDYLESPRDENIIETSEENVNFSEKKINGRDSKIGKEKHSEKDYDKLIKQKLDLLDEKMEYINETHEEMIKKKTLLAKEKKLLESYKLTFEKDLKTRFEKDKKEIESDRRRLERENVKLTREKINLNEQVTRLKMTIKAKDAEISRLTKEIAQKEKKEKEQRDNMVKRSIGKRGGLANTAIERSSVHNQVNRDSEVIRFEGATNITPLSTNLQTTTSISSNSSGSFIDRDLLIEEYLMRFDFEKELDLLYGILSTCFDYLGEELMNLPRIPHEINVPWCDIEKPYRIQEDEDLKTTTFSFPSGLVEIVFYNEDERAVCPRNTRKLIWTHLGWCVLVYPNGDIKAIKPDKNMIYHYVEKGIVKCIVAIRDLLSYDGEESKLHLSKFFSLKQLQCVDPETRKTYIIHSDFSKQIVNE